MHTYEHIFIAHKIKYTYAWTFCAHTIDAHAKAPNAWHTAQQVCIDLVQNSSPELYRNDPEQKENERENHLWRSESGAEKACVVVRGGFSPQQKHLCDRLTHSHEP